jgi:hypothetical protein
MVAGLKPSRWLRWVVWSRPGAAITQTNKRPLNVVVTGAARLYRKESLWTGGLATTGDEIQVRRLSIFAKESVGYKFSFSALIVDFKNSAIHQISVFNNRYGLLFSWSIASM